MLPGREHQSDWGRIPRWGFSGHSKHYAVGTETGAPLVDPQLQNQTVFPDTGSVTAIQNMFTIR